ncbi:hypothetical protein [Peribacillus deserti]|uniref:Uncharacterized protein n=1 Tax=Peribacillus deserti TaxID=673318 RepID=A0A2N5LZT4_9BACI|nr:hypothetical protein [Peribacillus deserti]PLT27618.1 hypothetical protein CUU66_23025 [Peribacillus deserti]
MKVLKWGLGILLTLGVIMIGFYQFNRETHKTHFRGSNVKTSVFQEKWERLRKEQNVSKHANIEQFHMIIDENKKIESIRFEIIEKTGKGYNIIHYSENQEEKNADVSESTSKSWLQYKRLSDAHVFFHNLDRLNSKGFLTNEFPYTLIASSGWNELHELRDDYYLLNNKLALVPNKEETTVKGSTLLVIGSRERDSFESAATNTKTVLISSK